ncbi:MAG: hypothetical protein NC548_02240, partial [Lachnospiraceae bacterium]|nr:hypothetical protein [Lachnospiraceae bacterium]
CNFILHQFGGLHKLWDSPSCFVQPVFFLPFFIIISVPARLFGKRQIDLFSSQKAIKKAGIFPNGIFPAKTIP